jgi:hypothetical protein
MSRRLSLFCLMLMPTALTGPPLMAQDAKSALRAVATHIGADTLRCVTYSGAGYLGIIGQNYTPRDDWPRVRAGELYEDGQLRRPIRPRRTGVAPGYESPARRRRADRGRGATGHDGQRQRCLGAAGRQRESGSGVQLIVVSGFSRTVSTTSSCSTKQESSAGRR